MGAEDKVYSREWGGWEGYLATSINQFQRSFFIALENSEKLYFSNVLGGVKRHRLNIG